MSEASTSLCPQCGDASTSAHGFCVRCAGRIALEIPDEDDALTLGGFELGEELGRGAMGAVYRARHVKLGRDVALKVILAGQFAGAEERRRFLFEAEAAAQLHHPNLVALYEHGEADGRLFHAMQLIAGQSLAARLLDGPLPPREAAALLEKCARAVQHAHDRGVLHRDLKPGNVLLDAAGEPYVTDFGLARRAGADSSLTLAGSALGTPSYMAPELAAGSTSTAAADVWSLGAMLYEMLAGQPPFTGYSVQQVLLALRDAEPGPLRGIERDLQSICMRCLEKEPARRYPSALELAEDLARWLRGEPVQARPVTGIERLAKWTRRRPAVAALSGLAVLLFVAGITGVVWQWRRADREAAATRAALEHAKESLWRANLDRAHALRISRAPGQRLGALAAIREAAAYRTTRELRDEAIGALALPDIGGDIAVLPLPAGVRLLKSDRLAKNVCFEDGSALKFVAIGGSAWATLPFIGARSGSFSVNGDFSIVAIPRGKGAVVRAVNGEHVFAEREGVRPRALSADGRVAFFCSDQGALESVDIESGTTLARGTLPGNAEWDIAPSPTGDRLAAWNWEKVVILATHDLSRVIETKFPAAVIRIAWAGDGSLFAGVEDNTLVHWHPDSDSRRVVARHDREGVLPELHPSGMLVASTAWDGVSKFTAPAWGELLNMPGARVCGFSADGSRMVSVRDREAVVSAFAPPDVWRPLPARASNCRRAIFSPDGALLATLHEREIALWDTATLALKGTTPANAPRDAVWDGPSSLLIGTGTGLGRVRIEKTDGALQLVTLEPLVANTNSSGSLAQFPDGRIAYSGDPGIYAPGARRLSPLRLNPAIGGFAASADGKWLAAGCWMNDGRPNSYAAVWTPAKPEPVAKLPAGNCAVTFSPDSQRLIVAETNLYTEYETGSWKPLRKWPRSSSGYDAVAAAYSPDGTLLAMSANEFHLRLLDAHTGDELATLASPLPRKAVHLHFSPDGRWLAVVSTGAAQLWDIRLLRERLGKLGLDWEKK